MTPDTPPMLLVSGLNDPIVRSQNTQTLAERLREQNVWVTEKYFEGVGHMETVMAVGAMLRWRMPVLEEMVDFFTRFGAFPSGVPRIAVAPQAAEGLVPDAEHMDSMNAIVEQLDRQFGPLAN